MPKVCVLMPVYNGENFIAQAIACILDQTFKDFELVVIDDGSTDATSAIINRYADSRIRYFKNVINIGLIKSLNRGLLLCNSKYIARFDCDDLCHPSRLSEQVKYLEANKEIFICGTWVKAFDDKTVWCWSYPERHNLIRSRMIFECPFAHSSVMLRGSLVAEGSFLYDEGFPLAEDYDLWERISKFKQVANIPKYLTYYRLHPGQVSNLKSKQQVDSVFVIHSRLFQQLLIRPNEEESALHFALCGGLNFVADEIILDRIERWLVKLARANDRFQAFPRDSFRSVLAERWLLANFSAVSSGKANWRRYSRSGLSAWDTSRLYRQAQLLIKSFRYCVNNKSFV